VGAAEGSKVTKQQNHDAAATAVKKQPALYDDAGAAEYMATSARHIQRIRARREIAFVRFGRKIRFKKSDLDAYLERNRVGSLA
jgi:excisionase family DNA binding protein